MKFNFEQYKNSLFQIKNDLRFWKQFLKTSIDSFQKEYPENRWIFQSGFYVYDITENSNSGRLKRSDDLYSIEIGDLHRHSDHFFDWIMNVSFVRVYNSVELLLLQCIRTKYFSQTPDPNIGKKEMKQLQNEIKKSLKESGIQPDGRNNRYLIQFLKTQNDRYKTFCYQPVRIDRTTSWENFFEFISILRHIISHNGMLISKRMNNDLKSIARDLYTSYFDEPLDRVDGYFLKPKSSDSYLNFLSLVNDFSANTVKFVANENNLKFIGME